MLRLTGKRILVSRRVFFFWPKKKRPSTAIPRIRLRRCFVGAVIRGGCEASNSGQKTSVAALAPIVWLKVAFQGGCHAN
jgi:hypothetical protein